MFVLEDQVDIAAVDLEALELVPGFAKIQSQRHGVVGEIEGNTHESVDGILRCRRDVQGQCIPQVGDDGRAAFRKFSWHARRE